MDPRTLTVVCSTGYVCTKVSYFTGKLSSILTVKNSHVIFQEVLKLHPDRVILVVTHATKSKTHSKGTTLI